MNFGQMLEAIKQGKKARRKGWNGKGIFIECQFPDEHSKMTHPYIYIDTTGLQTDNPYAPKDRVPWLASQTDMLAEDWEIVEDGIEMTEADVIRAVDKYFKNGELVTVVLKDGTRYDKAKIDAQYEYHFIIALPDKVRYCYEYDAVAYIKKSE